MNGGALALRPHLGHPYGRLAQQQGSPSSPSPASVPASLASSGRGPECSESARPSGGRRKSRERIALRRPFSFTLTQIPPRFLVARRELGCSPLQPLQEGARDLPSPAQPFQCALKPARRRLHPKGFSLPARTFTDQCPEPLCTPSRKAVRTPPPNTHTHNKKRRQHPGACRKALDRACSASVASALPLPAV